MKAFFDKLYFGGYYMNILVDSSAEYIIYRPLKYLFFLLGKVTIIRNLVEKQKGKTYEQHIIDSLSYAKKWNKDDAIGINHILTGWIFSPMLFGFWGDILMGVYTIFGEDIGFYKFNRDTSVTTVIFLIVAVFATLYLAFGSDERNRQVVKEYREKPKKEQLKAFALFNVVYIIVIGVFIALFAYNVKQNGGW